MAEGLTAAGNFKIDDARILTSTGLEVNILPSLIAITLYESTDLMSMSGNILMQDSANIANIGPIIGQEYLFLKIRTPTFKDETSIIDYTQNVFVINSLQARADVGNSVQGYLLNFVSSELIRNQRTKVNQVLRGSYASIVENLLVNYIRTKKNIYTEPTTGNKKIITPNVKPFTLITKAMKESISIVNSNTSYMFFENTKGFHFRSLASMYAQKPQLAYTTSISGSKVGKGGVIDVFADLQTILSYKILNNSDSLKNYTLGVFGSKLIVHDIFNKIYTTHTYNYLDNFDKESHIVGTNPLTKSKLDYPIYSATPVEKENRISDFPARTFVVPTSLKDTNSFLDASFTTSNNLYPFVGNISHMWLQKTISQRNQINEGFLIDILVHGNTMINAGDVVELSLPYKASIKTTKNEKEDKFYKGAFFIKQITHQFDISDDTHTMNLLLAKDSLEEEILSSPENFEPESKVQPSIYNKIDDFYISS